MAAALDELACRVCTIHWSKCHTDAKKAQFVCLVFYLRQMGGLKAILGGDTKSSFLLIQLMLGDEWHCRNPPMSFFSTLKHNLAADPFADPHNGDI